MRQVLIASLLAVILIFTVGCSDASSRTSCEPITSYDYRVLTSSFHPAPGHSYSINALPIQPCRKLSPLIQGDRVIERWYYECDTGLTFTLLVESESVIGYELLPQ